MSEIHNLLKRQIKKIYGDTEPPELKKEFIESIDLAYKSFDSDRKMLERSLELTSEELMSKNTALVGFIEELNYLAFHDTLTGLYNRSFLINRISKSIQEFQNKENSTFAVIYLDMDRFKNINDAIGHTLGDKIIERVAKKLNQYSSDRCIIARLSGDEFIIIKEDINLKEDVIEFIRLIQIEIRQPIKIDVHELILTSSIGIVFYNKSHRIPADILRDADSALYHAKKRGRDRFEIFDDSMKEDAISIVEMEKDLRTAIERNEFKLYYQAIVNSKTKKISGFEALIRWEHPSKGFIPPIRFIPIAEEAGMISQIGEWVLHTAAKKCKDFRDKNLDFFISVNLSFAQFREKNIKDIISDIITDYEIDPNQLYIELTESTIMENIFYGIEILNLLRDIGIFLSIDDFGTGYSSLSYLKKFPINKIKIDQSFVKDIDKSKKDKEIIKAIINIAHSLELSVTAEGVETMDQLEFLQKADCDRLQGYLISRPLPEERLLEFINNFYLS
jgi:diguanylate cyclase (GGDEF)-like protein